MAILKLFYQFFVCIFLLILYLFQLSQEVHLVISFVAYQPFIQQLENIAKNFEFMSVGNLSVLHKSPQLTSFVDSALNEQVGSKISIRYTVYMTCQNNIFNSTISSKVLEMLTTGSILNPGSIYSQQPQFCTLDFYQYFMFLGMYIPYLLIFSILILLFTFS